MTFAPSNAEAPYLPVYLKFEEEGQGLYLQLSNMYSAIAYRLNNREISLYAFQETLTGQKWTSASNLQKQDETFRKVFEFGAIAAGATLNIVHGITGITRIVKWYGGIVTAANKRPLPFVSATLITDQVSVDEDGTDIVIVNGATAPAIVSGTVVIEFLKN